MKAWFLVVLAVVSGCHHEHRERVVIYERQSPPPQETVVYEERPGELRANGEPPAPREETIDICPGSPDEWKYIPGHWAWHGHWEWVQGHWHKIPRGRHTWIKGVWAYRRDSNCWVWVGGRWD